MRKFDYSFLDNGLLPANLINLTSIIYSLKTGAEIRKDEYEKIFTELEKIAKVQSVKSSNAIEGIITSDERIKEIVNQSSKPLNHNEQEIAGYRDALNQIHLNYKDIEFNETTILKLHEMMMSYSGYEHGGKYKTDNNLIIEEDSEGNRKVRFTPTTAKETPQAMEQLILAYMDATNNSNINQLLLIPCVILDFLCIHPFKDGNGRISRLLSLLLLYKNGFDAGKYVSFEEQINNSKGYYYETLKESSASWDTNENTYIPFIQNFLSTLYMCYKELDKRFNVVNSKKITKKSRIEATVLNSLTAISKSEICNILPDVSPTTVESVLGTMVREEKIKIVGNGKNTKYIKNI
ncbi:MAG: Fic family protein [Clostridiales bacterium]|nr:Fic family protein [Clostridiales bacterium]